MRDNQTKDGGGTGHGKVRVLLDARLYRQYPTGIGRQIAELARNLAADSQVRLTIGAKRRSAGFALSERFGLGFEPLPPLWCPLYPPLGKYDLFHAISPVIWPPWPIPVVTTVHDLIYDDPRWAVPSKRLAFRVLTGLVFARAEMVLCVSETTRTTLVNNRRVSGSKTQVIYPGYDVAVEVARLEIDENEYVYVGNMRPHKGLDVLIAALEKVPEAHLSIVSSEVSQWTHLIQGCPESVSKRITLYRGCDDGKRLALLRGASAVIVPSYVEGYGLPVIEALTMGVAVICSDIPVFREIAGDQPTYFRVGDPDGLAAAIRACPSPSAGQARAISVPQGASVRWELFATGVRDCYVSAATCSGGRSRLARVRATLPRGRSHSTEGSK